jgi:hypothetical protein
MDLSVPNAAMEDIVVVTAFMIGNAQAAVT